MAESNDNCPSCVGSANSVYGPLANTNVVVQPYTPPTADELEFSRQFYANMKARTGHDPGEGIPVQVQAPEHEPVLTADMLQRLNAGEAVLMPDISGLHKDPNGPAARSPREAPPESALTDAIHRAMLGQDTLMPSQLTAPWFEPDGAERSIDELISELPPPPPPLVARETGPRVGRRWPSHFGEDIGRCQEEWLYDVEVVFEADLGEHVEELWSKGYESKSEAELIKNTVAVTEAQQGLGQVKADKVAAKAREDLEGAAIIATADSRDWEETLKRLVEAELPKLKLRDPCPGDCPMEYSVVGWSSEVESVDAIHVSTSADVKGVFVGGIDHFYHVVWTIKYRLKATYAVFAHCKFFCFGVDEF